MAFISSWTPTEQNTSDVLTVIRFINSLPDNFKHLIDQNYSNIKQTLADNRSIGITPTQLDEALDEAIYVLRSDMQDRNISYLVNEGTLEDLYAIQLWRIGFIGQSLNVKFSLLDSLWDKVRIQVENLGNGIIDIANSDVLRPFRKFLIYLNSILGSLSKVFTGVEPIKEFKEIIEALLGVAEE